MSRCVVMTRDLNMCLHVGLDMPTGGYFGFAYRLSPGEDPGDPDSEPFDAKWQGLTNYELCAFMRKHGVDLDDRYTRDVFESVQGDNDPGDVKREN